MTDSRFTLDCVDAQALYHALRRQCDNGSGYGLIDAQVTDTSLFFTVDRYAMDGNGSHVGTEQFTGTFEVHPKDDVPDLSPGSTGYVILSKSFDVTVEPAQAPTVYDETWAIVAYAVNGLPLPDLTGDDLIQAAHNAMLSLDDYWAPSDDFAYQELDHWLQQALADLPQ